MEVAERRKGILKTLCRRRYETISNLAMDFGVSERTIRRDIEALSLSEPIYTQSGRYGGGVYIVDGYYMERMYMHDEELKILKKLLSWAEDTTAFLSDNEKETLRFIITKYTKPQKRERKLL